MPWWALVYLVVFASIFVVSMYSAYRDGEKVWIFLSDCAAGVVLIYLFAGFWLLSLSEAVGAFAPFLFLLAMGWEIASTPHDLKEIIADTSSSKTDKICGVTFAIVWALPAYIVAGMSAFKT
jgi:hypothetical protein